MPSTYLCMGSMSAHFYENNQYIGGIAVSIYQDLTKHDLPTGDHYNAYLQWEVKGTLNHTNRIQNRHIPLNNSVTLKGLTDQKEIIKVTL